jgi:hypothetical protein
MSRGRLGIFGYGSLVLHESASMTLGRLRPAPPPPRYLLDTLGPLALSGLRKHRLGSACQRPRRVRE